eukprot:CAMPEP_0195120790 /NCGR_PEP_ID=MMETSP0448-20130528/122667_1 /TAXON_ID=66468 /ORGANISM="Heterocapsa triquestra, Strain CCMP 448" /LENGTH=31 /DNA_ID= /DNA_START= /DNA_END= /DNA_ORIENTATION=
MDDLDDASRDGHAAAAQGNAAERRAGAEGLH